MCVLLNQVIADSVAPRRLAVVLLSAFAGIALVLASVGIYGVMSFLVVQRTHEIGVRMALRAKRRDVIRLIISQAGFLIGDRSGHRFDHRPDQQLIAALGFVQVSAFDLPTFVFVTLALSIVAFAASYIPALRATRSDPMIALSHNA